jgi:hypothetical protein
VLWISLILFWFTSLVFPAATQWGTFLHSAGPVHVLLILSALLALDAFIVRVGKWRGWTRPVAWLGPALSIFGSGLFTAALLPSYGAASVHAAALYDELGSRMAAIGHPLDRTAGPVITNFPIWMAEAERIPALALPDEPPADVLDLAAAFPGTHLLVLVSPEGKHWPADLAAGLPGSECFHRLDLGPGPPNEPDPLADVHAYEVGCP